jgi:hypothetical protein
MRTKIRRRRRRVLIWEVGTSDKKLRANKGER